MDKSITDNIFTTISQRAAFPYLKLLTKILSPVGEVAPVIPLPVEDMLAPQQALHAFFSAFYKNLYEYPDRFGLPLGSDLSIAEYELNAKDKKQEVKRLLDKPRAAIASGLDFLMLAGVQGRVEGSSLVFIDANTVVKQSKIGRKFLQGFESVGLTLSTAGELQNAQFPQMMTALQALAQCCAAIEPELLGKFQFACCDFRALLKIEPTPMDLYGVFEGETYERVVKLHHYFSAKQYKASCDIHDPSTWVVKYQGDRKVKATPLFQIEYDSRYSRPLRMQIKCASTSRIADLLPQQPQMLQDDFIRRANGCRGDECGWCRNNKNLGPTVVHYRGEPKTVCWYTTPDVHEFNENTVELIQQYEQMHAKLVPEN
jgi:hypothetical protein